MRSLPILLFALMAVAAAPGRAAVEVNDVLVVLSNDSVISVDPEGGVKTVYTNSTGHFGSVADVTTTGPDEVFLIGEGPAVGFDGLIATLDVDTKVATTWYNDIDLRNPGSGAINAAGTSMWVGHSPLTGHEIAEVNPLALTSRVGAPGSIQFVDVYVGPDGTVVGLTAEPSGPVTVSSVVFEIDPAPFSFVEWDVGNPIPNAVAMDSERAIYFATGGTGIDRLDGTDRMDRRFVFAVSVGESIGDLEIDGNDKLIVATGDKVRRVDPSSGIVERVLYDATSPVSIRSIGVVRGIRPECGDGLDNDGDGLADAADPGCASPAHPDESPACNDDHLVDPPSTQDDNDTDGLIDYPEDDGCVASWDTTETGENALKPGDILVTERGSARVGRIDLAGSFSTLYDATGIMTEAHDVSALDQDTIHLFGRDATNGVVAEVDAALTASSINWIETGSPLLLNANTARRGISDLDGSALAVGESGLLMRVQEGTQSLVRHLDKLRAVVREPRGDYLVVTGNGKFGRIDQMTGSFTPFLNCKQSLSDPRGIDIDPVLGLAYISNFDDPGSTIYRLLVGSGAACPLEAAAVFVTDPAEFRDIAFDASGRLVVATPTEVRRISIFSDQVEVLHGAGTDLVGVTVVPDGPGACNDRIDNDGDDKWDWDGAPDASGSSGVPDPGCRDAFWSTEEPECEDGVDNGDGDGADLLDPECQDNGGTPVAWRLLENPGCSDGMDNDNDGMTDWDGAGGEPDPECGSRFQNREELPFCGVGFELALVVAGLAALRGRIRRRGRPA